MSNIKNIIKSPEKGSRKFSAAFRAQIFLIIGLLIVGLLHLPVEFYWAFVGGVVGNAGAFMWGNSKEYSVPRIETKE